MIGATRVVHAGPSFSAARRVAFQDGRGDQREVAAPAQKASPRATGALEVLSVASVSLLGRHVWRDRRWRRRPGRDCPIAAGVARPPARGRPRSARGRVRRHHQSKPTLDAGSRSPADRTAVPDRKPLPGSGCGRRVERRRPDSAAAERSPSRRFVVRGAPGADGHLWEEPPGRSARCSESPLGRCVLIWSWG